MGGESDALPIELVASSLADLKAMPRAVRVAFGGALRAAQMGQRPEGCRPFGEGIPREVMKMTVDFETNTYRMAFSWALPGAVYLPDVFKKKSKSGRSTPQKDVRRIIIQWKQAQEHHRRHYRQRRHHAG